MPTSDLIIIVMDKVNSEGTQLHSENASVQDELVHALLYLVYPCICISMVNFSLVPIHARLRLFNLGDSLKITSIANLKLFLMLSSWQIVILIHLCASECN